MLTHVIDGKGRKSETIKEKINEEEKEKRNEEEKQTKSDSRKMIYEESKQTDRQGKQGEGKKQKECGMNMKLHTYIKNFIYMHYTMHS